MDQQEPDVKQQLLGLQTQIDRLSMALHEGRETQDDIAPFVGRLSHLTQECTKILDKWTLTDLKHTRVLGDIEARLNDWSVVQSRFQHRAHESLREFERRIEQEWEVLRRMFEQPVRQIQEQAETLHETSVAVAGSALTGMENAETRLARLEADLSHQMNQLSQEIRTAIAGLRAAGQPASNQLPASGTEPWPFESVVRLHDELRGAADTDGPAPSGVDRETRRSATPADTASSSPRLLPESASSLAERMNSIEQAVSSEREAVEATAARTEQMSRAWRSTLVLVILGAAAAAGFVLWLDHRVNATLADATARVAAAERQAASAMETANERVASIRTDADHQIADARQVALEAQVISGVLAAPDLIRFSLTGGASAPRAAAQVLWSRSRGVVFSGSRIPAAPPNSTYQLWLLTAREPVSVALVTPDAEGRILLSHEPPDVPRPVIGMVLTLEPSGGRQTPTGTTVLSQRPSQSSQ